MTKRELRNKIFEILKKISETGNHHGLLIVYSDIPGIIRRGAHPLGQKPRKFKEFEAVSHINDDDSSEVLKKVGDDGAILVNKDGYIYSPAVYLNVNLFSFDQNEIEQEFCARHIAALATSSTTKASVYTLSEETGKVREFIKGEVKRKHPGEEQEKILEIIKKDLKEANIIQREIVKEP